MIKRSCLWCAVTALVFIIVSSCSFGLQPVSSKNNTVVALRLSGIELPDGTHDGRAIVQGSGYLYLRTFGGPTGDAGPFYGPYAVAADATFKTADIPAGTYSDIALIFSANPISETKVVEWKGASYSFKQLMSLPDAVFTALVEQDGQLFDGFFDGDASTGMTGKATVRENKTTTLSSVLIPTTGMGYILNCGDAAAETLPAQPTMVRKFYGITGLGSTLSASEFDVSCAISPGKAPLSLGIVALYASDGVLIKNFGSVGSVTETKTLTATVKKADYYFLYIEYQSSEAITLGFSAAVKADEPNTPTSPVTPVDPPVSGTSLTVNFAGNETVANKMFYYKVYDLTSFSLSSPEQVYSLIAKAASFGETAGTLCGYGAIVLDANGNGSGNARSVSGGPLMVSSAGMYVASAFVDFGNRYSGTVTPDTILDDKKIRRIVPRIGDFAMNNAIYSPIANPSGLSINFSELAENQDYVFFVDAGSDGSGYTFEAPTNFSFASSNYFDSSDYTGTVILYLVSGVSTADSLSFRGTRILAGAPGLDSPPTITYTGYGNFLFSNTGSDRLILDDVIIKGSGTGTTLTSSLITAQNDALILGDRLTLTDCAFTESGLMGGAVHAANSNVTMLGAATISSMVVVNSVSSVSVGGAVYLNASSLSMYGTSVIQNCTGWQKGGGVYIDGSASGLIMNDASSIHHCSARQGGGVYSLQGAINLICGDAAAGVQIHDCSVTEYGGGMFLEDVLDTQLSISGFVRVTGNSATTLGGGLCYTPTNAYNWESVLSPYIMENTSGGNIGPKP